MAFSSAGPGRRAPEGRETRAPPLGLLLSLAAHMPADRGVAGHTRRARGRVTWCALNGAEGRPRRIVVTTRFLPDQARLAHQLARGSSRRPLTSTLERQLRA